MKSLLRNLRYDWPLHFVLLLTNCLPDNVIFLRLRGALARPFLGSCGANLRLGRNITFYNPSQIHIGRDVYIAYGCWFVAGGKLLIESEVMLGPYVVISAGNHTKMNGAFRFGPIVSLDVVIGAGCWIGSHVTINGGVSIGKGCLIASNSALTKGEFPDQVFLAGIPATIKKKLADN